MASCYREKLLGVGMVFVAQSVTTPMPLHPKAKEFAKSGLFAGVKSFAELERRIVETAA